MLNFDATVMARLAALFAGRTVLLLEDEDVLGEQMRDTLLAAGFAEVIWVTVGDEAARLGVAARYDVLLLDRLNPGIDGLEVLRRIRESNGGSAKSPALFVTLLGGEHDRLAGLLGGADDYVPKPVSNEELLARVAAQLRNSEAGAPASETAPLVNGPLRVNPAARTLSFGDARIELSGRGFDMLVELLRAGGAPLTHAMLWDRCWTGWNILPDEYVGTVNTAIRRMRQDLAKQMPAGLDEFDSIVANVWGKGFIVRDLSEHVTA